MSSIQIYGDLYPGITDDKIQDWLKSPYPSVEIGDGHSFVLSNGGSYSINIYLVKMDGKVYMVSAFDFDDIHAKLLLEHVTCDEIRKILVPIVHLPHCIADRSEMSKLLELKSQYSFWY
jgi:hypothetical protein